MAVLDLEDGVTADRKDAARAALVAARPDPGRVIVRVNPPGSPAHQADLGALRGAGYRLIMLPKMEHTEQLGALAGWQIVALCETPRGILTAASLAAASNVVAVMWGAEDLIAAVGVWVPKTYATR